jgi:hypothetical protein
VNCKSFELLHAATFERDLAVAVRRSAAAETDTPPATAGGRGPTQSPLPAIRWSWMARFPIGFAVCLAMLALLAVLGGAAAAPSYPEVATPSPLARFVLGPLPSRRAACIADSPCGHPRPQSLPPSP